MDAHVKAFYDDIEANYDEIQAKAMREAEDRWLDAGCPSNGFDEFGD
jgi:hypothetical protein